MRGYSAVAQGQSDLADLLFDESAAIEIPERTHSRNKPHQALAGLRRGDTGRALQIMRSDVEDLWESDNVFDIAGTAVAFMSIMAQLGRYSDAARLEGYLIETKLIRTPILRGVINDARQRIAATAISTHTHTVTIDKQRQLGRALDGHGALTFMRDVL